MSVAFCGILSKEDSQKGADFFMKKLWQKQKQETLNTFVEMFETKDDIVLDQKLVVYDIAGSLAHANMLQQQSILSIQELEKLQKGLLDILHLEEKNQFQLTMGDEDIHTKIENYLIEHIGEPGKKIHTGRSRNDQVLTALRLFTKDNLLNIREITINLVEQFLEFAKTYTNIPLNLKLLQTTYHLINQSPLGSAAGFGAPIHLDKQYTAGLLGFATVQENSLYCQNSKGKFEGVVLATLIAILSDLNKLASDVLLFTTSEFHFLDVDVSMCTGSSMMPQKKNVDLAELIRSKVHLVIGNYVQIMSLSSNLISGYNRDSQDIKKPLMESLTITQDTIQATTILLQSIKPNKKNLSQALTPELFATHKTLELTQKGISFRDAYEQIGKEIDTLTIANSEVYLKQAKNIGDTGNLRIGECEKKIAEEKKKFEKENKIFQTTMNNLL